MNELENFPILDLPPEIILNVLKNYTYERLGDISVTCKTLYHLIKDNRNSLASKNIYHIDLEQRRVRAWRNYTWCDRIPFRSFEYISEFFCNVNVAVLTINKLDEETLKFLLERAQKRMLRVEQLRLFHSVKVPHKSIRMLMQAMKCNVINFEAVESKMEAEDLEEYKEMTAICFEMDDSIDASFFGAVLQKCDSRKFIFHACDKIPQSFVRDLLQKWYDGSRKFDAVRITTNQNFNFDDIILNLTAEKIDNSTWKMINAKGDKATITMRRNNFHFFMAFEVNNNRVEDILYKIPFIE